MNNNQKIRYALDLELEQPFTNPQTPDSMLSEARIIQVGVVFFDTDTAEILHDQAWYVNIGVPLSSFIKQLTGITDANVEQGVSIKQAYDELLELIRAYNCIRRPIVWGSGDLHALQKEAGKSKLGRGESNVKAMWQDYGAAIGANHRGGLSTCLNRAGLGFVGRAHDALVDAYNTMRMYNHVMDIMKRGTQ